MHRLSFLTLLVVSLLVSGMALASGSNDARIGEMLQAEQGDYVQRLADLSDNEQPILADGDDFNDFPRFGGDIYSAEHRSIGKAFLYSFLVPGLGEYYVGSKIKAGVFLALEALTWVQYMTNHSSGVDKEDEFRAFADEHWSATDFTIWLIEEHGSMSDSVLGGDDLPAEKSQQYYEMIGKYDKFYPGWDDYDPDAKTSARQQQYVKMRDEANNKLNTARTWAMVALANHVLSAFDAAISAKRFNSKRDVFSNVNVKARLARYNQERIPQLVMTYRFY